LLNVLVSYLALTLYCVSASFGVGGIVKFALKALKRYLISSNIKLVLVKKKVGRKF
jgi:hypothetical protein